MRLIPIGGFISSGKSLAALRLALSLKQENKTVCLCLTEANPITAALFGEYDVPVHTVEGNLAAALKKISESGPDTVIIEFGGLQANLKTKLSDFDDVAPLTIVTNPTKLHATASFGAHVLGSAPLTEIVNAQLKEADIILTSHCDLQDPSENTAAMLHSLTPEANVIRFSAKQGDGTDLWLNALRGTPAAAQTFSVPDVQLTRYDCDLHIAAPLGVYPDNLLDAIGKNIRQALATAQIPLAGFQLCTVSDEGVAIVSCTDTGDILRIDRKVTLHAIVATLYIRLGAIAEKAYLYDLVYDAIQHACTSLERGMTIVGEYPNCFDDDD